MLAYTAVKTTAKMKRREAEKLSHGMIHRIAHLVDGVRRDGETLVDCITRILRENEELKAPIAAPAEGTETE